jgi:hypothetical protein
MILRLSVQKAGEKPVNSFHSKRTPLPFVCERTAKLGEYDEKWNTLNAYHVSAAIH